jgi:hypothetical protein
MQAGVKQEGGMEREDNGTPIRFSRGTDMTKLRQGCERKGSNADLRIPMQGVWQGVRRKATHEPSR